MDDGQRLADSQGIPFLETSAKSNVNIDEAFMTMAKLILEKVLCEIVMCLSCDCHVTVTELEIVVRF